MLDVNRHDVLVSRDEKWPIYKSLSFSLFPFCQLANFHQFLNGNFLDKCSSLSYELGKMGDARHNKPVIFKCNLISYLFLSPFLRHLRNVS